MSIQEKNNIINKIKKGFAEVWKRIVQIDIPDNVENLTAEEKTEVNNAKEVQKKVHSQRSFVPRVDVSKREMDPVVAKYGEAKPGNPIYDVTRKKGGATR